MTTSISSTCGKVGAVSSEMHVWRGIAQLVLRRLTDYTAFMVFACIVWQVVILLFDLPPYLLPSPALIVEKAIAHHAQILDASLTTLIATLTGLVIAMFCACALACLFLAFPLVGQVLMPLLVIVRTIPMIAIAPLLVMLFGRGSSNSIGMVALLSFFQILLSVREGIHAPTSNMLELMHACGASFWQTFLKVRLPGAIPHLFTGLRIASASAILCAMFAEWLSGGAGLGSLILDAYSRQDFALMWATVVMGTSISYVFFTTTMAAERAALSLNC
jgi:ABC-type nitrate/sulfonate/bicarbonate transport system permease component